jgi:hypothetical protein
MANDEMVELQQATPLEDNNTEAELSPAEIESRLVEQQGKTPADMAAIFFKMHQPRLNMIINQLSAKQLRRVIFNATSYPFVSREYAPRDENEKAAAFLMSEMMLNKAIMQLQFEMEKAEKAFLEQQNSAIMDSTNTSEGEGNNG